MITDEDAIYLEDPDNIYHARKEGMTLVAWTPEFYHESMMRGVWVLPTRKAAEDWCLRNQMGMGDYRITGFLEEHREFGSKRVPIIYPKWEKCDVRSP